MSWLNCVGVCTNGAPSWRSYTGHFIVHKRQKTGGELYFFCYTTEGFSSICVYVHTLHVDNDCLILN